MQGLRDRDEPNGLSPPVNTVLRASFDELQQRCQRQHKPFNPALDIRSVIDTSEGEPAFIDEDDGASNEPRVTEMARATVLRRFPWDVLTKEQTAVENASANAISQSTQVDRATSTRASASLVASYVTTGTPEQL